MNIQPLDFPLEFSQLSFFIFSTYLMLHDNMATQIHNIKVTSFVEFVHAIKTSPVILSASVNFINSSLICFWHQQSVHNERTSSLLDVTSSQINV